MNSALTGLEQSALMSTGRRTFNSGYPQPYCNRFVPLDTTTEGLTTVHTTHPCLDLPRLGAHTSICVKLSIMALTDVSKFNSKRTADSVRQVCPKQCQRLKSQEPLVKVHETLQRLHCPSPYCPLTLRIIIRYVPKPDLSDVILQGSNSHIQAAD